jgi:alpha-L-rhamnosidase
MFPSWVWEYFLQSGDTATLSDAYPVMSAVADYVRRYIDPATGLVTNLEGGSGPYLHGIIDWPETMRYGHDMDTAARTVINILAVSVLRDTARAATVLGRDPAAFEADAAALTTAINARLRRADGVYLDGLKSDGAQSTHASQIANAYAVAYGVVPEESRDAVLDHVAGLGMRMGPMTAHWLLTALDGRPDQVVRRLTDTGSPGWADVLAKGGTFTWESWDADTTGQSMSHPWGAAALVDIQRTLLGVRVTSPGAATVAIRPPASGLSHASGSVPTQRGDVAVTWRRTGRTLSVTVDVPVNMRAEVELPEGRAVRAAGEARYLGERDGHAVYSVGSGRLTLTSGA